MKKTYEELKAWVVVLKILGQYILYRLGLRRTRPTFLEIRPECKIVIGRVLRWHKRLRFRGAEKCPKQHPAVFCCNHFKKDDPFVVEACIYDASDENIWVIPMMRDDFFKSQHKFFLFDPDELVDMFGTLRINRERVSLSQIKPFVEHLRNKGSFLMFPGRTRSRTGLFMEYREGFNEPGGPAFFAAQAQRTRAELQVALAPVARSYNPATKKTTVSFGKPILLDSELDRVAQRKADFALIEEMGRVLEVHMCNLLATYLYLWCLHGFNEPIDINYVKRDMSQIINKVKDSYNIDVDAINHTDRELTYALNFFKKHKVLRVKNNKIFPCREKILLAPPWTPEYFKQNPVKFLTNQILHLGEVIQAIEKRVLSYYEHKDSALM